MLAMHASPMSNAPLRRIRSWQRHRSARHVVLLVLGLLALLFVLAGCDSDPDGPVFADGGVRVETFFVQERDFDLNREGDIATYVYSSDLLGPDVVNNGAVIVEARGDLIFVGTGANQTWAGLPFSQGVEVLDDEGFPYVEFTVTYGYSYAVGALYLDVVTSAPDASTTEPYIPDDVEFKLTTISGGAFIRGLDHTDLEAVKQAYGLPD